MGDDSRLKRALLISSSSSWTVTISLLLVQLAVCLKVEAATSPPSPSVYPYKISLGVYKEELSSPIFYQTFVPLIFEYTVPSYKTLDITLRDWREKCVSDSFAPSYTCPVFFHFERYLERFEQEVVPKAWMNQTKPSAMKVEANFCNKIQRHFPGAFTSQYDYEEYIEKLRLCPISELRLTRDITDYVYNIKALFKKMNDNYENEFSNKFFGEANKKTGPAFYVSALSSHQNGMLVAYWVEKTRWSQAALACSEQRIPEFLVKPENITKAVGDLKGKLGIGGQVPSVSLEELSIYYKLPLTDCTYVETTGNFVVRISVPVLKKEMQPKLVKFQTVPFIYEETNPGNNNDTSGARNRHWCQMKPIHGRFIVEEWSGLVYSTECLESDPLCLIREYQDISTDLCVKSIVANSTQGVRRHCSFECVPLNETYGAVSALPETQRVASDTWVFTGGSARTDIRNKNASRPSQGQVIGIQAILKCSGRRGDEAVEIPSYGALEVRLPCECRLEFKSELFFSEAPCMAGVDLNPIIRHIVPVHFYTDETLVSLEKISKDKVLYELPKSDSFYSEEVVMIKKLDGTTEKRVEEKRPGGGGSGIHGESSYRDGGNSGQLGTLWTLVILEMIAITTLLVFGAYRYWKQRRELSYSKERLVYNVYPSPSNPSLADSVGRIDNMNHL